MKRVFCVIDESKQITNKPARTQKAKYFSAWN